MDLKQTSLKSAACFCFKNISALVCIVLGCPQGIHPVPVEPLVKLLNDLNVPKNIMLMKCDDQIRDNITDNRSYNNGTCQDKNKCAFWS